MISARREFLEAFLGALGAAEIVEFFERPSEVWGKIRFAEDFEVLDLSGDEEEHQEFVWRVTEADVPSILAYRIAAVMQRYQLLHIDKLRVPRETVLESLRAEYSESVGDGEFALAMEELLAIEVAMVDEGEETDVFFIHG